MPLAARNGVNLHIVELGAAGPPVVMLHGLLLGSLATWYFTAAQALTRRHRVLLFDLRGHGRSERPPSGYDVATHVADLGAVVSSFTDEPVALVGHSFGAVVALRYAIHEPARVRSLALVEAPLPPSRLAELDEFLTRPAEERAGALPEALRGAVLRGERGGLRLLENLRALAEDTSLLADLRAAEDVGDDELARLVCPVLAVYGAASSCRPAGRRIARAAPDARLVEVEGGHFLPLEAPAALTHLLTGFLHA